MNIIITLYFDFHMAQFHRGFFRIVHEEYLENAEKNLFLDLYTYKA